MKYKRFLLIVGVLLMLLALSACGAPATPGIGRLADDVARTQGFDYTGLSVTDCSVIKRQTNEADKCVLSRVLQLLRSI